VGAADALTTTGLVAVTPGYVAPSKAVTAPPLVLRTVVTVAAAAAVVATEYATLTLAKSDRRALDGAAAVTEVTVTLAAGKAAAVATAPAKAL
jgi:hypothetical protein